MRDDCLLCEEWREEVEAAGGGMRLEVMLEVFNEVDYLKCRLCAVYAYPERDDSPGPVEDGRRWRHMIGDNALPCKVSRALEERYQAVFGSTK